MIRQHSVSRIIVCYLALYDCAVRTSQIVQYCDMMYDIDVTRVSSTLLDLKKRNRINNVRRGWWKSTLKIVGYE